MRKAAWGAIALAVFAVATMRPIADIRAAHSILSLGALAGYLLLSWDPPTADRRFRAFLIAGVICGLASFILAFTGGGDRVVIALASILAIAAIALPLWLLSRPVQPIFGAAAAIAGAGPFLAIGATLNGPTVASVAAFALAGGAALWIAWRLEKPASARGERLRPRIAVAYDVIRLTPDEKAERLAHIEARFKAGQIPEHKYWDLRQEIESK